MLELLLMHVAIFSILGQPWLAIIRSSRRGRLETTMGCSLLPRVAPLLPHARRWEALATTAPLLLPQVWRRWEALATAALLLLPRAMRRLHRMTRWRCGWWLHLLLYAWWPLFCRHARWLLLLLRHAWWLLLQHTWRRFHLMTPPRPPRATMMNAPMSKR
jgi:hypothetical protein